MQPSSKISKVRKEDLLRDAKNYRERGVYHMVDIIQYALWMLENEMFDGESLNTWSANINKRYLP